VKEIPEHSQSAAPAAALRELLVQFPAIQIAFLLGSAAKGRLTYESDIDVAVAGEKPLDAETKRKLIEAIAEETSRPVDLIDLQTAAQPILGEALGGTPIFSRNIDHHEHLITRAWDLEADFMPDYRAGQRQRLEEFAAAVMTLDSPVG